jgi:hypothetical protein
MVGAAVCLTPRAGTRGTLSLRERERVVGGLRLRRGVSGHLAPRPTGAAVCLTPRAGTRGTLSLREREVVLVAAGLWRGVSGHSSLGPDSMAGSA